MIAADPDASTRGARTLSAQPGPSHRDLLRRLLRDEPERGSMTVETAFLLVLLVVPLFYLVGTLARVQAGAYAVSAAAREAARSFVTAEKPDDAGARAWSAADLVFTSHGFSGSEGGVEVRCGDAACLEPGGRIIADAQVAVPLPLVPDFMEGVVPTSITLTATHVEIVDAFRE